MGFFDKLKQAANFVTGGGAKVQVLPLQGEYNRTDTIRVKITAEVKDAPLSASSIYLEIRSKESVALSKSINGKTENINEDRVGYTHKLTVSGTQELAAGQSYEWEAEFTLPQNALPTFHGSMAHHIWQVKGALDVKGNDPDSGWVEILVR